MKKKIIKISLYVFSFLALVSCKEEIMSDIDSMNWNNERSIVSITFENQVGTSSVTYDKDKNTYVSFMFDDVSGNNSKVKIKSIELSVGATSDVKVGDELDFDNVDKTAYINVTSHTGVTQKWIVSYIPFFDELVGTWSITKLTLYGGLYPNWGITGLFDNIVDRTWDWREDGTGPIAEYDNKLIFTLEGVTEDGNSYGTVANEAGADGLYANFFFVDSDYNLDVNDLYRKIPAGESKWERDFKKGTVTFTQNNKSVVCSLVHGIINQQLDSQDNEGDNNYVTIENYAFQFEMPYKENWDTGKLYTDFDKIVDNPRKLWIQIKKD